MGKTPDTLLTQEEFASLQGFANVRTQRQVPTSHKQKLVRLGFLEEVLGGFQPTKVGRKLIANKSERG